MLRRDWRQPDDMALQRGVSSLMRQQDFQYWVSLSLSVLVASSHIVPAWAATDWYMLKANGKTIGKVGIQSYKGRKGQDEPGNWVTEVSNTNHFVRQGSPFEMNTVSRFVENPATGKPLRFSYRYALGEQQVLEAQGYVEDGQLDLRMIREDSVATVQAPVSSDKFLFPGGEAIRNMYKQHYHDAPGSRFSYQTLNLGISPEIVDAEVTLRGQEKLALATGETRPVRAFEIQNPGSRDKSILEWRDAEGKLYKSQTVGSDGMEMVYASRQQVRKVDQESLDLVATSAVLSNKIPQPRITTEAIYRIAAITGQHIDWSHAIPESDNQEILQASLSGLQSVGPDALYLKVSQQEPSDASIGYPITVEAHYLQSSPFVQAKDPSIEQLALQVVGKEQRAYYAARLLQQWVYKNIAYKDLSLGFASAKDTLLHRQGDCTEHAVLLAALTRSLGIPSRVAVGLIYIPEGESTVGRFVYHMWNEVYIGNEEAGEWIPLDATNPEVMVDATHIKISDSALTGMEDLTQLTRQVVGLMGKMKIDVLKAISPAESTLVVGRQSGVLSVEIPKVDIEAVDIRTLSKGAIKHFRVQLPPASLSLDTADGLFTYGMELLSKGQYDSAHQAFQKALTKVHRPVEYYSLGERLAGVEMYDLARQAFQQAVTKDSNFRPMVDGWLTTYFPNQTLPEPVNRSFMLAIHVTNNAEASSQLQRVIASEPQFGPAYRHLGEISAGTAATDYLKRAVALDPKDFRNPESLGDKLMEQGHYYTAVSAYRAAAQALQGNRLSLAKPWLENVRGKMMVASGAGLLAHNKRDAQGWLTIGKGLLRQGRQDEAQQAFTNALSLSPGNSEAELYRFRMALDTSDWRTIYAHKDRIAGLSGSSSMAAALLGQYQMRTRQYSVATHTLQHAIALNPHLPTAYELLVQTYLRLAEQQAAKPNSQNVKRAESLKHQAVAALRRGIPNMMVPADRHALSLRLTQLLLISGKDVEALQRADSVLAENPINGRALYLKGKAQFYGGDNAGARQTLETALVLNPNDPEILCQLGHVAKEEGRDAVAVDFYQKAYKVDPLSEEAATAYRNLLTQLQIVGQKPPDVWYLSDDEHDYLVQLLYQVKQVKLNTREYLSHLASLPGSAGQVQFSLQGIEAIQSFQPFMRRLYQSELNGYQRLQSMAVPVRFNRLHDSVALTSHGHLQVFESAIQHYPTLEGTAEESLAFGQTVAAIAAAEQSLGRQIGLVGAKLPEPVFKGLLSEAELNDMDALNRKISGLASELASQVEKAKPAKKAAPKLTDPVTLGAVANPAAKKSATKP